MYNVYRKDEIIKLSTNKSVLHLGFIQHSHLWKERIEQNDWLHSKLIHVADKVVGIDYLCDEVSKIKKDLGYDVHCADVMYLDKLILNEKFDVIVCGELIEHIENPGLMLDGIKKFMHDRSILIVTTPNPWRKLWVRNMSSGIIEDKWLNKEHVAWYSFQTLKQLLDRKGYSELKYQYYLTESNDSVNSSSTFANYMRKIKTIVLNIYNNVRKDDVQIYQGLFFVATLKHKEEE